MAFIRMNGAWVGGTGSLDAQDVLNMLKTVDGEGSGIDADSVDGKHIRVLTFATFSALGAKDPNTIYHIVG